MSALERTKQQQSDEIAQKVAAFLAAGGQPYQAKPGETADKDDISATNVMAKASHAKAEEIAGMRFGRMTVLRRTKDRTKSNYWWCVCDCGNEEQVEKAALVKSRITECNRCRTRLSCNRNVPNDLKRKSKSGYELAGIRFGNLVAIRVSNSSIDNKRTWHCKCDCGNAADVITTKLIRGIVVACAECSKKARGQVKL